MHRRMGLKLAALATLPAAIGQAQEAYPPLLSRQHTTWNTPWEEVPSQPDVYSAQRTSPYGQVIQSGYSVPASSSMECAPQRMPSKSRSRAPRECPPEEYCPPKEYCPPQPQGYFQPQGVPAPQYAPQGAPGMFAAPQGRGEVSGESHSIGIRGFAIRLPAMQLELPTIQLPSLIRYRREPEMRMDAAYAPYVEGVPAVYGQLAPGGIAHVASAVPAPPPPPVYSQGQMMVPASRPACPPPATPLTQQAACPDESLRQELAERERQIKELESKLERFQALEQTLNQLSQQQEQLRQELLSPGCAPPVGRAGVVTPPIDAPAPDSPPPAPPAELSPFSEWPNE